MKNNLERIDEIRFSPENDDVCHVNDLYIANDKLYVSMFSYPPRKNSLSFANKTYQGVILEYSLQERKVVKICHDKLLQPHSVLHYDNKMFYCVSGEFLVKRNEEDIFKCLGYTRGLAVRNQTLFVGQSESRQIPVLLNKHTNILLDCGIYVHDISTKLSSFIHIPSEEIYGILVI
ncbi:TIGR03032 family protein [Peribacillus frigoritolerans]|uniref:TIGR03032 family protein n=1 Tax=Peribacillus frigoritolerans TaxID=450367 RepID=UPI00215A5B41|nr:TIGR03032 family protein [Peribacillus frigoritolerans]MCR8867915.1 TIGR03032 family protein [Peribacillus frigoritolerans]